MNYKLGDIVTIEIYGEASISNYLNCPICNEKYSESNIHWDHDLDSSDFEITCKNCKSTFEFLNEKDYNKDIKVKIKRLEN